MDVCEMLRDRRMYPDDALTALRESGLADAAMVIRLRDGDHLIREKDWLSSMYILLEGAVRVYRTEESGREMTDSIIAVPGLALLPTVTRSGPVMVSLQALTPGSVLSLPLEFAVKAIRRDVRLMACSMRIMRLHLKEQEKVTRIRFLTSTEDRYHWYLEQYGDLAKRIELQTIASFLGMSAEHLSRVRKKSELGCSRYRKRI